MKPKSILLDKEANNIDGLTRDEICKKYENLIYKVANSFYGKISMSNEEILGNAREGFVFALNKYRKDSTMTFGHYAAYTMRWNILMKNHTEGFMIRPSQQILKKYKADNKSFNVTVSMEPGDFENLYAYCYDDINYDEEEQEHKNNMERFYRTLESKFSPKKLDIFFRFYGLHGYSTEKCIDIAKHYGISPTAVSLGNKKILDFLRENKDIAILLSAVN